MLSKIFEGADTPQVADEDILRLCDVFEEENISQQIKETFQAEQQTPLGRNKKIAFWQTSFHWRVFYS